MIELSEFGYVEGAEAAHEFNERLGAAFSWAEAMSLGRRLVPRLAKLNADGDTEERVTEAGSDYMYSRIDYSAIDDPQRVRASRNFSRIMSGNRTKLAFWRALETNIRIHQGEGMLMVGQPDDNRVRTFMVDSAITPSVSLSPRTFYSIKSGRWSRKPLVISTLHLSGPHDDPEVIVRHDPSRVQDTVVTPEGPLKVPVEFNILYELRNC